MKNKTLLSKALVVTGLVAALVLAGCAGSSSSNSSSTTSNGTVGKVSSLTVTDQVATSGTLSADQLSKLT